MEGNWFVDGARAIACWLSLDLCNERLRGYYMETDGGGVKIPSSVSGKSVVEDSDELQFVDQVEYLNQEYVDDEEKVPA